MQITFNKKGINFNYILISWVTVAGILLATASGVYASYYIQSLTKINADENIQVDSENSDSASTASPANSAQTTARKKSSTRNNQNSGNSADGNSTSVPASYTSPLYVGYGDTRTNHDVHQQIVNLIAARNPRYIFHVGDLVEDGMVADQWNTFNLITAAIFNKLYPVLGNHEKNSALYYSNFSLPGNEEWYTVASDYFNFIALDTNVSISPGSEQHNWLTTTLQASDRNKLTVVWLHHPPYGTAKAEVDPKSLRTSIVPLFEQYGVDLVLCGDHHDYERSYVNGVYYIVVGGGGAPLNSQVISSPYSQLFLSSYNYSTFYAHNGVISFNVYNQDNVSIDHVNINNR